MNVNLTAKNLFLKQAGKNWGSARRKIFAHLPAARSAAWGGKRLIFAPPSGGAPSGIDSEPKNQWAALRAAHEMVSEKPRNLVLVGMAGIEPATTKL